MGLEITKAPTKEPSPSITWSQNIITGLSLDLKLGYVMSY